MTFILENWAILIAALAMVAIAITAIINFFKKPSAEQKNQIQAWLLYIVTEAEREFGSGTGELKLSYVYDLFIGRFPTVARIMSFEMFKEMVDKALDKMEDLLTNNQAIYDYVTDNFEQDQEEEKQEE